MKSHDANYITADDLYLSAVSDGRLYDMCMAAGRTVGGHRKERFTAIINRAWMLYRDEVNQEAIITTEAKAEAVTLLEADRVQHVAETDPPQGMTFRSKCQRARVTFHPEWDTSQPWASYIDGTAGRHFKTLAEAAPFFAARGLPLILEK